MASIESVSSRLGAARPHMALLLLERLLNLHVLQPEECIQATSVVLRIDLTGQTSQTPLRALVEPLGDDRLCWPPPMRRLGMALHQLDTLLTALLHRAHVHGVGAS